METITAGAKRGYEHWTKKEVLKFMQLYPSLSDRRISIALGRSERSITYMKRLLKKEGFTLPRRHISGMTIENVRDAIKQFRG